MEELALGLLGDNFTFSKGTSEGYAASFVARERKHDFRFLWTNHEEVDNYRNLAHFSWLQEDTL